MGNAKMEKAKKSLVDVGLMTQEEEFIASLQANYVDRLFGKFGTWKRGWAYFTDEKLIVNRGLLGGNLLIPYKNIRGLGKCTQTFFPIGITITYEDIESGKTITDKFSMMKREKWLEFLSEKSGVSVS